MNHYYNHCFTLYSTLHMCLNDDTTEQLDIYPQLKSLYDYFNSCVFSDDDLQNGGTYILPMEVSFGLFEEEDYDNRYTNPASDEYDSDLVPFVESHNMHIEDGFVCITLKSGTSFICERPSTNRGPYHITLVMDGYPIEWYDSLIFSDGSGVVPYVIKA